MKHAMSICRYSFLLTALSLVSVASYALRAQERLEPIAEDAVHDELRALRVDVLDAFAKKDIDRLVTHLHEDVVVTLQNAEVCEGRDAVRAFHVRMSEGDDRSVQSQQTVFEVDDLSVIHGGDAAIARGSLEDQFELTGGMAFQLQSRWSAALVKQEGRWLVASFHASTNMFDNGVSDLMLKWNSIKVGGVSLFLGVAATAMVFRMRARRA